MFKFPIPLSSDLGLLLLRIGFGSLMLVQHGWGKMLKLFGEGPIQFADPFGLGATASLAMAVFAEVVCAFLIIIGFKTRWATIPLIITMLVAVFMIHWEDPFGKKEFALLYLIPFICLLFTGGGRYSLDAMLGKNNY